MGKLAHGVLEQILSRANLLQVWKRVRANGGAAGIDGVTTEDFPAWLQDHWSEVKASLLDGSYRPSPVRRHEIPKRSGANIVLDDFDKELESR
ncbi:hypothetical protein GWO43_11115 [candidate division KSB1 bacterium]|nr:hypothetical protein [candidate division KSB1 bacterium]NIR70367.1 hypothetical protein [candidate division KSB1 bacterium]NIS24490.1 hypothetical protein [candidate division KSB1 bacterium]NIT71418.1 hypothetical protein [candidate division KSB1 bacterium]NIU25096.1 hypothetical protein [candidate division KSB1 bacterium]